MHKRTDLNYGKVASSKVPNVMASRDARRKEVIELKAGTSMRVFNSLNPLYLVQLGESVRGAVSNPGMGSHTIGKFNGQLLRLSPNDPIILMTTILAEGEGWKRLRGEERGGVKGARAGRKSQLKADMRFPRYSIYSLTKGHVHQRGREQKIIDKSGGTTSCRTSSCKAWGRVDLEVAALRPECCRQFLRRHLPVADDDCRALCQLQVEKYLL